MIILILLQIELDNNSQVHPKTPTDSPNRFSSSAHVQPNLGIPVTRVFKIASINLASLYKHIDQLGIYILCETGLFKMVRSVSLDTPLKGKIEIEMAEVWPSILGTQ